MNRRLFIEKSILGGVSLAFASEVFANHLPKSKPKVKWGIAIITWKDDIQGAFRDVSDLGIHGIQIRANVFERYKNQVDQLRTELKEKKLAAMVLSGGNVGPQDFSKPEKIAQFVEMAVFLKKIGGRFLQATTIGRDAYPPGKDTLKGLADSLNVIGAAVKKEGIQLLIHNHMHQLCQTPEELDQILSQTNPDNVGLLLDVAHFRQGGGNPSEAIIRYKNRLKLLHIKDLLSPKPGHQGKKDFNYQFMELGKGNQMDFPSIMESLKKARFKGWCMVELDAVPNPSDSPKKATETSLDYLREQFGYRFG
jgi:inosose dehydratase